jgi:hypothetical protein
MHSTIHLDRRTVSRKTPLDGKLEISGAAASRLAEFGPSVPVEWNACLAPATLSTLTCSCGKRDGPHDHHFLESSIFTTLPAGADVDLFLRAGTVHVTLTQSD